jgi:hypothetical protein
VETEEAYGGWECAYDIESKIRCFVNHVMHRFVRGRPELKLDEEVPIYAFQQTKPDIVVMKRDSVPHYNYIIEIKKPKNR